MWPPRLDSHLPAAAGHVGRTPSRTGNGGPLETRDPRGHLENLDADRGDRDVPSNGPATCGPLDTSDIDHLVELENLQTDRVGVAHL